MSLRDTDYAKEIASVENDGCKIERLFVKHMKQEEIRFSWWKEGKMMMRPLDLPEDELLILFEKAFETNVFTDSFKLKLLKSLLKPNAPLP